MVVVEVGFTTVVEVVASEVVVAAVGLVDGIGSGVVVVYEPIVVVVDSGEGSDLGGTVTRGATEV
jgi:hypothetical protein